MSFPADIDERIFFSDADYSQEAVLKQYQELYNAGNYSAATNLLKSSGINYLGEKILSDIETQIVNIERYLNESESENFMIISYSYPIDIKTGMHWISAKSDFTILTEYASDLSELYTNNEIGLIE